MTGLFFLKWKPFIKAEFELTGEKTASGGGGVIIVFPSKTSTHVGEDAELLSDRLVV